MQSAKLRQKSFLGDAVCVALSVNGFPADRRLPAYLFDKAKLFVPAPCTFPVHVSGGIAGIGAVVRFRPQNGIVKQSKRPHRSVNILKITPAEQRRFRINTPYLGRLSHGEKRILPDAGG